MNETIHHASCPVCGSAGIDPLLSVKDHTVSGNTYVLWQCADCTLRFTQDVPDATGIGRYYKAADYISHTDQGSGMVDTLYKKVRRFTLQQKVSLIKKESGLEHGSILDVGAGTGAFLNSMKAAGWRAAGVEPDTDARRMAQKLYGLKLDEPEAMATFPPGSFDAITLWHVLEHVHDLHPYMAQLHGLLRNNGRLFLALPNYTSLDASVYGVYWAAYDVPRHLYHFTPGAIAALLARHGFELVLRKPMWFDAFYISLLSSRYRRGGNANWLQAGFTALRSNLQALVQPERCSSLIYVIRKKQPA